MLINKKYCDEDENENENDNKVLYKVGVGGGWGQLKTTNRDSLRFYDQRTNGF